MKLNKCGSVPTLPGTTPQPRAQAFSPRGKVNPLSTQSISSFTSTEDLLGARVALKEKAKLQQEVRLLLARNEKLSQVNEALKAQARDKEQEVARREKLVCELENFATKSKLRYERLMEALASLKLDERTELSGLTEGSSLSLPSGTKSRRTKIDWGGSNDEMFKTALALVARERNEIKVKAHNLEKQVKQLRSNQAHLEKKVKELEFQKRYAAEMECCSSCGQDPSTTPNHKLHQQPNTQATKAKQRKQETIKEDAKKKEDIDIFATGSEPEQSSDKVLLREALASLGIDALFKETDLSSEGDEGKGIQDIVQNDEKISLSKSQAGKVKSLISHVQESLLNCFQLLHEDKKTAPSTVSIFDKISSVVPQIIKGAKHATLWVLDHDHGEMWTKSHRKGREIRFRFEDEQGGIAGQVARSGRHVTLNSTILTDAHEHYDPKIDHLGSSREFFDVNNPRDRNQKHSLTTIPIFNGLPRLDKNGNMEGKRAWAVLQVSKSASKANPIHKRVFTEAEVLVLSHFAHSAFWLLQNSFHLSMFQSQNLAMRAILEFPFKVISSVTSPPNERKSESAKVELMCLVQKYMVDTVSNAKRCRFFVLGTGSKRGSLFFVAEQKDYEIPQEADSLVRSSCNVNSGLAGIVAREETVMILDHAYNDPRFNANIDLDAEGLHLICFPVFERRPCNGKVLYGVAQLALPLIPRTRDQIVDLVQRDLEPQITLAVGLTQTPLHLP